MHVFFHNILSSKFCLKLIFSISSLLKEIMWSTNSSPWMCLKFFIWSNYSFFKVSTFAIFQAYLTNYSKSFPVVLNGKPIEIGQELNDGDMLMIGGRKFLFNYMKKVSALLFSFFSIYDNHYEIMKKVLKMNFVQYGFSKSS